LSESFPPDHPVIARHASFANTLAGFVAAHRRVENTLNIAHYETPERGVAQIRASGWDVHHGARLLGQTYELATEEFVQSEARLLTIARWPEAMRREAERHRSGDSALSQLRVVAKAFFFFSRGYQDAMVRMLLLAIGQTPGRYTSMSTALSTPNNPMSALVDAELATYRSWFGRWTDLRDKLKAGVTVESQMVEGHFGLVFVGVPPDVQIGLATGQTIFLAHFADTLDHSAALADAVVDRAIQGWDADARAAVDRQD
jgi:hypothetical protein